MTNRDVGLLTFRALSIYALIRALEQTEWILYRWPRTLPKEYDFLWRLPLYLDLFAPFMFLVICSLVLWRIAPSLSNRMFIPDDQATEPSTISLNDIKAVVFLAIGLYLLVDTISPLVQTISSIYAAFKNEIDPSSRTQVTMLRITTTLKIGLGLWLVFGNKGATNILKKIRNE